MPAVRFLLALLAVLAASRLACAHPGAVTPRLGPAFGTVVVVEGVAVDGSETRKKEDEGKLLLRIEKVDGQALPKAVTMPVRTFEFVSLQLPRGGERFKLVGYESGGFEGIPDAAFAHIPRVATPGFGFRSQFLVLKKP